MLGCTALAGGQYLFGPRALRSFQGHRRWFRPSCGHFLTKTLPAGDFSPRRRNMRVHDDLVEDRVPRVMSCCVRPVPKKEVKFPRTLFSSGTEHLPVLRRYFRANELNPVTASARQRRAETVERLLVHRLHTRKGNRLPHERT